MPSSVNKRHAYDAAARRLTVTFVSGRVYAYRDVPRDVAEGLRWPSPRALWTLASIPERQVLSLA